jgi:uncharacterized membrane protein
MNFAHIHIIINHLPIAALGFGFLILLVGWYLNDESFARAGYLVLALGGIFAVATFYTGGPAAHVLKDLPNFPKEFVHEHAEAADFAVWFTGLTGLLAAFTLWVSFKKKLTPKKLFIALLLINAFTLTVLARTNYLGGLITHTEVR